jgi:choline/glycine/proline betaine transport protein
MSSPSSFASILARVGLPNPTSLITAAFVAGAVLASVASMETANSLLIAARGFVLTHFDWLFIAVANLALAGVALLAVHPRGKIRLGSDSDRPEFSRLSWFAMLFSAGLGPGLLFWATAEPIIHLQDNPFLSQVDGPGQAAAAATLALRITLLHWGIHGWALYVLTGLGIAVYAYRHGQRLTFRTSLFPMLGPKWIDRWPGMTVDVLALLGTVAGVATSIGLSASSINATLASLIAIDVTPSNQIAIIFIVCGLGVLSALSGLTRGIRMLSELNVWGSALLLGAVFLLGPTLYLGALLFEASLDYLIHVIPTGLFIASTDEERVWQGDWTVFYWGWWLAWTPFVGLFIARISKGRTIREFAIAVLLVPAAVTLVWMVVLGGTALSQEAALAGAVSDAVNLDYSRGLVAMLDPLGPRWLSECLVGLAAFLLLTWLVTSLDSATLVICHLLEVGESPAAKIFWGFLLAAVAAILLKAGGLAALQAVSIVIGLPLAVLTMLLGAGLLRDLFRGGL